MIRTQKRSLGLILITILCLGLSISYGAESPVPKEVKGWKIRGILWGNGPDDKLHYSNLSLYFGGTLLSKPHYKVELLKSDMTLNKTENNSSIKMKGGTFEGSLRLEKTSSGGVLAILQHPSESKTELARIEFFKEFVLEPSTTRFLTYALRPQPSIFMLTGGNNYRFIKSDNPLTKDQLIKEQKAIITQMAPKKPKPSPASKPSAKAETTKIEAVSKEVKGLVLRGVLGGKQTDVRYSLTLQFEGDANSKNEPYWLLKKLTNEMAIDKGETKRGKLEFSVENGDLKVTLLDSSDPSIQSLLMKIDKSQLSLFQSNESLVLDVRPKSRFFKDLKFDQYSAINSSGVLKTDQLKQLNTGIEGEEDFYSGDE